MSNLKAIGLMSGTSMDGIDAVLLETDGYFHIKQLAKFSLKYSSEFQILLKSAEYTVRKTKGDLNAANIKYQEYLEEYLSSISTDIMRLTKTLALYLYNSEEHLINLDDIISHSTDLHEKITKDLIAKAGLSAKEIDVIGYHGQALYHNPAEKITIQVGDGRLLASNLGIKVINNFRINDIKNGGQGAPLAPLYHHALAIRDNNYPLIILNCGGIANITIIGGKEIDDLMGFDTGPGNVLIDKYIKIHTENKESMDKDGKYGKLGKVNEEILQQLYNYSLIKDGANYFDQSPPKSLDSGDCRLLEILSTLKFEDACATLEAFTAYIIIDSLKFVKQAIPKKWILAGGGWNNPVITEKLKEYISTKLGAEFQIYKADDVGWDSQYMEAEIFAYLAVRSLKNLPITYPSTTNCKSPTLGGEIYY